MKGNLKISPQIDGYGLRTRPLTGTNTAAQDLPALIILIIIIVITIILEIITLIRDEILIILVTTLMITLQADILTRTIQEEMVMTTTHNPDP